MANTALISILCADHAGLIADVTGRLYELGVNLGDTTFAVLGGGAEFTLVAKLPAGTSLAEVEQHLAALPALRAAKLTVHPFEYRESHDDSAHITHRIEIAGDDSPGLIARLSEVFRQYGGNIVRLNSESAPSANAARFVLRLAVFIPADKAASCMAAVANTAGQMHLKCQWQQVA
jgi:glycine cleavage system transcriptional repressor